ncbi:hypothetical protein GCM10010980_25530 [Corynebacterium marinum]|nr:hypothetical protein GCM10010980_25530 [Corynebacterium marinum]
MVDEMGDVSVKGCDGNIRESVVELAGGGSVGGEQCLDDAEANRVEKRGGGGHTPMISVSIMIGKDKAILMSL